MGMHKLVFPDYALQCRKYIVSWWLSGGSHFYVPSTICCDALSLAN